MKFVVIKSKTLVIAIVMILVMVLLSINVFGSPSALVYFGSSGRLVPVYCVDTQDKKVAISFDSAWGADKTLGILELLKDYNAQATFFLVGFWVEKYPEMVSAIDEQGIEIGTHSNTYPDFAKLSNDQIQEELSTSINSIKAITQKDVKLFRFPYGSYSNTSMSIASSLGLTCIQWDVDTLDWKGISGSDMVKRVVAKVKPGSIILCHNNSDNILDGLRLILDYLTTSGYTITSVSNVIYHENYYIDHAGMQRLKKEEV